MSARLKQSSAFAVSNELLVRTKAVELRLEDGSVHTFDLAQELDVPVDPRQLVEGFRGGPARFAFWAYQAERILYELRDAEHALKSLEGTTYLAYRADHMERTGQFPTEGYIRSCVDANSDVRTKRRSLDLIRRRHATVRLLKDALVQRHEVLRRLLSHPS